MRRFQPIRTLQVAATVTAFLCAQAPAFAQPAPTATPAPTTSPAPTEAPAPTESPAPAEGDPGAWNPQGDQPVEAAPAEPAAPAEAAPPAEPEPPAEPPVAAPGPEPAPAAPAPTPPADTRKAKELRNAGIGTMIAGGVVSLVGFGMTIGYTVKGTGYEKELITAEDNYQKDDCSRKPSSKCDDLEAKRDDIRNGIEKTNDMTRISGGLLAGGLLVIAVGGILYRIGVKRMTNADIARVRISPTIGGLSISGRF